MVKKAISDLKSDATSLLQDGAAAGSIQPSEHLALYVNMADSLGVIGVSKSGDVVTLTLADGTTVTITETTGGRPSGAQYHALAATTSARPAAADMTAGANHRDSTDGNIPGWPTWTGQGYLWIWSSHALTFIANGVGNSNLQVSFAAPVRLLINGVNGYLYGSLTQFTQAALRLDWRVR